MIFGENWKIEFSSLVNDVIEIWISWILVKLLQSHDKKSFSSYLKNTLQIGRKEDRSLGKFE